MPALDLRIPPPAVALAVAVLMWLASQLLEPFPVPFGFRLGVAIALALAGQGIAIGGIVAFRRAKTTINPLKPEAATALVSGGVYRYTRNPMYVGMLVTLLAWGVFLASVPALLFLPVFVLYIERFQIEPEERVLSALFGAEYAAYRERVRRWL